MPLSAHDSTVAVFVRGLTNLKAILTKSEAHALAAAIDPAELIGGQLAHDMHNLAVQVHWAAEGAKLAVARLVKAELAPSADKENSFIELYALIDKTVAYLSTVKPDDLEVGLAGAIELKHRGGSRTFTGAEFLLEFAIPNFYFHVTTAYAILRQKGVPITKSDFTGVAFG